MPPSQSMDEDDPRIPDDTSDEHEQSVGNAENGVPVFPQEHEHEHKKEEEEKEEKEEEEKEEKKGEEELQGNAERLPKEHVFLNPYQEEKQSGASLTDERGEVRARTAKKKGTPARTSKRARTAPSRFLHCTKCDQYHDSNGPCKVLKKGQKGRKVGKK